MAVFYSLCTLVTFHNFSTLNISEFAPLHVAKAMKLLDLISETFGKIESKLTLLKVHEKQPWKTVLSHASMWGSAADTRVEMFSDHSLNFHTSTYSSMSWYTSCCPSLCWCLLCPRCHSFRIMFYVIWINAQLVCAHCTCLGYPREINYIQKPCPFCLTRYPY